MKKTILTCATAFAAMLMSFKATDATTWALDKAHAKLGFSITHLMVSDVEGSFKNFDATITGTKPDFSDAVVNMTADMSSVNTDNDKRDEHLRGADFFDVAKYPIMTFKSTSFKKVGDKKYTVSGNLTLHGVTRAVTMTAICNKGIHPMNQKEIAGFKITGTIKRTDFGISPSSPSSMLSNEVELKANAEFSKN